MLYPQDLKAKGEKLDPLEISKLFVVPLNFMSPPFINITYPALIPPVQFNTSPLIVISPTFEVLLPIAPLTLLGPV
ncbi:hypothetical protein [Rickettsia sibirica]|uniref:hypothetical protein n=1 Tax=Rickettsia sibirica TaxID=35793 RepID=UPI00051898D4|nr:hypothetical protein [Rickettsia sibirica]